LGSIKNGVKQPSERREDFYKSQYDVTSWDTLDVPSNWEVKGYGTHLLQHHLPASAQATSDHRQCSRELYGRQRAQSCGQLSHRVQRAKGLAAHVLDSDPTTFWHTNWSSTQEKHPHDIQIDLGETVTLIGFAQLPRQGQSNGRIRHYEFYAAADAHTWGDPVAQGAFAGSNELQTIRLDAPVKARFVKLVALDEWSGQYYTTIAELDVMAAK